MAYRVTFVDTSLSETMGGERQSRYGRDEPGAQLVAACCKQAGHSVAYIRPDSADPAVVASAAEETEPQIIVLFPYTYTKHVADGVGRLFKDRAIIVYGGYHAGIGEMPKIVIGEGIADYVIAGRGEYALPELLAALESGKQPPQIITQKRGLPFTGLPWMLRVPELTQRLDREPVAFLPPRELCDSPKYCISLSGSVGCDARCDFCPSWTIDKSMSREPADVVNEMRFLWES